MYGDGSSCVCVIVVCLLGCCCCCDEDSCVACGVAGNVDYGVGLRCGLGVLRHGIDMLYSLETLLKL